MAGTKSVNENILERDFTTRQNLKKNTEDDSGSALNKSMNDIGLKSIDEIEEILDFAKNGSFQDEQQEVMTKSYGVNEIEDRVLEKNKINQVALQNQITESPKITENAILDNVKIIQKGDNAILENVEIIKNDDNIHLDSVEIVEKNELKDVAVRTQPTDISPKQDFEEKNKGHFEKKPGAFLFWGFVLCCCVVSAPLGGGFAFVFVPAQAASFGLCVFWKRGEKKVWVVDEVSNPGDKLVSSHNTDTLVNKIENPDALVNVDKKSTELLANLLGNNDPKALEDIKNLTSVLDTLSENETKGFGESVLKELKETIADPKNTEIVQSPKIAEAVNNIHSIDQNDETARQKASEELVKAINEMTAKTPELEELKNAELKNEVKLDEMKSKEEKMKSQQKEQEEMDKKVSVLQSLKSNGLKSTDLPKSSKNNTRSPGI